MADPAEGSTTLSYHRADRETKNGSFNQHNRSEKMVF